MASTVNDLAFGAKHTTQNLNKVNNQNKNPGWIDDFCRKK